MMEKYMQLNNINLILDKMLVETSEMLAVELEHYLKLWEIEEEKAGFNPNQPRIPTGNPTGGQWTTDLGGIAQEYGWENADKLDKHFKDHGKDFNSKSAKDYSRRAKAFYEKGFKNKLPMVQDRSGNIRIYNPKTNTFGSYNKNGTPRTFFKPADGVKYFEKEIKRYGVGRGKVINPLPSKPVGVNNIGRGRGGGFRGGGGGGGGGGFAPFRGNHNFNPFNKV